jgi:hypothetical protein
MIFPEAQGGVFLEGTGLGLAKPLGQLWDMFVDQELSNAA